MLNQKTVDSAAKPLLTVCQLGRLGDIVATEPAYRFLHERYPERKFRWYTRSQYVELLKFAPYIDEIVTVPGPEEYLKLKAELPAGTVSYEFNFHKPALPAIQRREFPNLLRQFTEAVGLEVPDETPRFHFDPALARPPFPEGYVVLHCASRGKNRQWPEKNWRRLAEYLIASGRCVVEIGMEPILSIDSPGYVDRTGEISLQAAARIIADSAGFIGVESGFGHIANATGVFSIIITGKLRNYPDYVTYSGRYGSGIECNLIRFYDLPASRVPFRLARDVVARFLAGNPMSGAECDRFCLVRQIKTMRRNPGVILAELLRKPFDRVSVEWEFFRRKHARRSR